MKRLLLSGLTLCFVTSMLAATAFADTPLYTVNKPLLNADRTTYSGGVLIMGHGYAFRIVDGKLIIEKVDFGGGEGILPRELQTLGGF